MATPVILPKFSVTMEEGTLLRWLKAEGEPVREGEPIAEIMTEKVNMEVEAPVAGVLLKHLARPDEAVPIAHVIAYIGSAGERVPEGVGARDAVPSGPAESVPGFDGRSPVQAPPSSGTVAATPIARRLAREMGVDLGTVRGTGPGGRITEADVGAAAATPRASVPSPAPTEQPRKRFAGRRRVIAERVARSAREIPHIHLTREIEMAGVGAARGSASYTAVFVWAAAQALRVHPTLRAQLDGDAIVVHDTIHIGVAVDTPEGLIVPVVRDADRLDLAAIGRTVDALVGRARAGTLSLDDVSGATFTVTNLGIWGVDEFTALINPPESAILTIGTIRMRPWVVGPDAIAIRPICRVTLALDHRIADGRAGADFLATLSRHLETIGV